MSSSSSDPARMSRETVRALAVAAGLKLTPERLDALAIQAEPYFDQIRSLDDLQGGGEPAAIFRLDDWETLK